MSSTSRQLARIQLDRRLSPLIGSPIMNLPGEGWIRFIRQVLGMTQAQLASRLEIKPPSLQRIEKAEVDGGVTIKTMRRVAEQLGCRFEYVLIPESGSFDELVRRRARHLAEQVVEDVESSMALEGQDISQDDLERMKEDTIAELLRDTPSRIWECK